MSLVKAVDFGSRVFLLLSCYVFLLFWFCWIVVWLPVVKIGFRREEGAGKTGRDKIKMLVKAKRWSEGRDKIHTRGKRIRKSIKRRRECVCKGKKTREGEKAGKESFDEGRLTRRYSLLFSLAGVNEGHGGGAVHTERVGKLTLVRSDGLSPVMFVGK